MILHKDMLTCLNLPTLKYRQLHDDMKKIFKILQNLLNLEVSLNFKYCLVSNTRENKFQLLNRTFALVAMCSRA